MRYISLGISFDVLNIQEFFLYILVYYYFLHDKLSKLKVAVAVTAVVAALPTAAQARIAEVAAAAIIKILE